MIEQIMNGDKKAFDAFYWQYVDKLFGYFFKRTQSHFHAEELTQLTFIKFWEYRSSLNPELSPDMQLYYKARITYIDWLRKAATQRSLLSQIIGPASDSPDNPPEGSEKYERARMALEQLPEMRKKVLTLFYLEGYNYKEIATLLGIAPKTVDNHIYQGIAQLRKILLLFIIFFPRQ
ncbi:RNA polymerase sigma factor [Niabella ginsenosidivorans]|uniref:RNA polymerase sigma factor n=1 Tax=Niabella ginsenosidivorans TaxID=1176587 RepID=UPI0012ECC5EE|nr:RNA polymerase sigma factor [Niabella ginsenosidivorans]